MKRKTSLIFITLSSTVFAGENFIELGAEYISAKDNITYIKDKKRINLERSPTKQNIVVPVVTLQYNGFFIGAGNNSEGIGYRHDFDNFSVEAAINSYEVFQDPYLTTESVELVEMGVVVYKSMYEMFDMSLGYKNIQVDDKASVVDTQQSANQLDFNAEVILLPLSQNAYGGLGYHFTYHDAKGKSNSYLKNAVSIFTIFELEKDYELSSQVMYADYKFDKKNSHFSELRDENSLTILTNLKVDNIFDSKDFFLQINLFYTGVESNINFFEKEYTGGGFSIGYKF